MSSESISKPTLKALGAKGVVTPALDSVQVILGPQAEIVASKIRETLNQLGHKAATLSTKKSEQVVSVAKVSSVNAYDATEVLNALGGKSNLKSITLVALTRLKVELNDDKLLNLIKLKEHGVVEVINLSSMKKQLYIGEHAENILAGINQLIK